MLREQMRTVSDGCTGRIQCSCIQGWKTTIAVEADKPENDSTTWYVSHRLHTSFFMISTLECLARVPCRFGPQGRKSQSREDLLLSAFDRALIGPHRFHWCFWSLTMPIAKERDCFPLQRGTLVNSMLGDMDTEVVLGCTPFEMRRSWLLPIRPPMPF